MILAIDVGNTNMVFGIYDTDLVASYRIAAHQDYSEDEFGIIFHSLLNIKDKSESIEGGIIASLFLP